MELATVVSSMIGVFFAAVAAWGAVEAVWITREIQREANIRRVIEALASIIHAADLLVRATSGAGKDELIAQFQSAQLELVRAGSLPFIISGPAEQLHDQIEDLERSLNSLTVHDNDIWNRPQEARAAATRAAEIFASFPPAVPRWWYGPMKWVRTRSRSLARFSSRNAQD